MNAHELKGKDWTCYAYDACPHALFIACLLLSCGLILSFAQKVAMSQQNRRMRQSKKLLRFSQLTVNLAVVSSGVRCSLVVSEGEHAESNRHTKNLLTGSADRKACGW